MTDEQDYRHRFFELAETLDNAAVWASMLDNIVDDIGRFPSMSRREAEVSYGQLVRVKDAMSQLDATCHQRAGEGACRIVDRRQEGGLRAAFFVCGYARFLGLAN
jgi:hypothetical protein